MKADGMRRTFFLLLVLILAAGRVSAAPTTVRISVDTSGASTRLVLTHSAPVSWRLTVFDGKIEVAYALPVSVDPAEKKIDDGILAGWKTQGDRSLVLLTGPGYRSHENFELQNPSRLVLDLAGDRPKRSASAREASPAGRGDVVIVVDPGHGGVETGAIGPTGLQEKDITLDLARRLKTALERDGKVKVALTRDENRLVPLDDRTAIANHNRAELFVSIHLNASKRTSAVGAETYFLAPQATDDEARILAALENKAYGAESEPSKKAGDRGLELILWDLAQNQYMRESSRLAESIQGQLNALTGTRDRGVRQAPFRVLMGATMPAILVEVGFISNPEEEARFKEDDYKGRVVEAIARAVEGFRKGRASLDGAEEAAPGADR